MAERDAKGRFIPGTSGNPEGLSVKAKQRGERLREALYQAVSLADFAAIAKKAVEQAKRGDAQARKLLFEYLIGSPQQQVDVTTKGESLNDSRVLTDAQRAALLAALIEGAEGGAAGSGADE